MIPEIVFQDIDCVVVMSAFMQCHRVDVRIPRARGIAMRGGAEQLSIRSRYASRIGFTYGERIAEVYDLFYGRRDNPETVADFSRVARGQAPGSRTWNRHRAE